MEILIDYVEDDLPEEAVKDFEAHLVDCEACMNFINTYKKTIKMAGTVMQEDMPKELEDRIKGFLRDQLKA